MTIPQLQTLKADINSKLATVYNGQTFTYWLGKQNYEQLANYYNQTASPQVDLWNPALARETIINNITSTDFLTLSQAKRELFLALTSANNIDATITAVRNHFSNIFGTSTTLTNLTAIAKKAATIAEGLYTTNNVCAIYGTTIGYNDIKDALIS